MKAHILVLARNENHIREKIQELNKIGYPYSIVCGKKLNISNTIYREPRGKYDAINYGYTFIPKETEIVILNDVDTEIKHLECALKHFKNSEIGLVFCKVSVKEGPQITFYKILDNIRKKLPITASGELMLITYKELSKIIPIKPCKAEDSYILYKVLENKKIMFEDNCYVNTVRTKKAEQDEDYKRRTVCGIYQALSYTNPPLFIKLFYYLLPLASPLLLLTGKKGYYWMKGILLGISDYLRGDVSGVWSPI